MFFPNIVLPWLINTWTTFYFRSVTGFPGLKVFFTHKDQRMEKYSFLTYVYIVKFHTL